nr:hypothetical protein [Sodalis-like endosymbiont of Proechinophthirus fluctus]
MDIAITDNPTVNVLGSYFSQQQFLHNLDVKIARYRPLTPHRLPMKRIRNFCASSHPTIPAGISGSPAPYYQTRKKGDARVDTVLLNEFINAIQFLPRDDVKKSAR